MPEAAPADVSTLPSSTNSTFSSTRTCGCFAATREWALHRLDEPLTLDLLARQAAVSPRTFSRRFVEETGYTPMQWVMRARIDMARELLERSERSVEQIATDVGLGTGANLRTHFQRILGTTPSEYRRTFTRGE